MGYLGQACSNVEETYDQFETDFEAEKLSSLLACICIQDFAKYIGI